MVERRAWLESQRMRRNGSRPKKYGVVMITCIAIVRALQMQRFSDWCSRKSNLWILATSPRVKERILSDSMHKLHATSKPLIHKSPIRTRPVVAQANIATWHATTSPISMDRPCTLRYASHPIPSDRCGRPLVSLASLAWFPFEPDTMVFERGHLGIRPW